MFYYDSSDKTCTVKEWRLNVENNHPEQTRIGIYYFFVAISVLIASRTIL